jgi:hypothetical protein
MPMEEPHLGTSGAKRTSFEEYNARDLLLKLRAEHPDIDDADQMRDMLIFEMKKDFITRLNADFGLHVKLGDVNWAFAGPAFVYIAVRTMANTFKRPDPDGAAAKAKAKAKRAAEAAFKAISDAIFSKAIKRGALLDTPMVNGKKLRHCTGAECLIIGGWYGKIGETVKAKQLVGDVLTEEDLQRLAVD